MIRKRNDFVDTILSFWWLFFFLLFKCFKASIITQALALFLFAGIGYGLIPSLLLSHLQNRFVSLPDPQWKKHNTIILLTGGVTEAIIADSTAWARIHTAIRLYRACKASLNECTILISGGNIGNTGYPLADNYEKDLLQAGIPKEDMVVETNSVNTWQNAKYSCAILQKKPQQQSILVTSGYHLKRAVTYFSHFGIQAVPILADRIIPESGLLPTTENIESNDTALHEYLGLVQYYVYYFWLPKSGCEAAV